VEGKNDFSLIIERMTGSLED